MADGPRDHRAGHHPDQAGWSAEALLRCCVHSVNGMQNFGQRVQYGRAADPEFVQLLAVLGRIQRAGGMGMRITRDKDLHTTTLFFRPRKSGPAPEDVAETERLLGIDAFLMFLFTRTETGGGQVSPVITVPAG